MSTTPIDATGRLEGQPPATVTRASTGEGKPMAAVDVKAALSKHWPDDRFLHVYEAPLDHGRQGSKIDVLVMGLWQSKGHQLDAVEVKVSYSDWCREWRRVEWVLTNHQGREITRDRRWPDREVAWYRHGSRLFRTVEEMPPEDFEPTIERRQTVDIGKNAEWRTHAHRFWIAAPERLAQKIAHDVRGIPELSGWGVLAVTADDTRVLVAPKFNRNPTALSHRQYLGIIRAAADSGVQAIWRAEARGRNTGFKEARDGEARRRESMWRTVLWAADRERAT